MFVLLKVNLFSVFPEKYFSKVISKYTSFLIIALICEAICLMFRVFMEVTYGCFHFREAMCAFMYM